MRLVPEDYRTRFFTKANDAPIWQAKPVLTGMLRFRQHNLMEPLREKPFDLVFLKNVLIYFDAASKKTVMDNVRVGDPARRAAGGRRRRRRGRPGQGLSREFSRGCTANRAMIGGDRMSEADTVARDEFFDSLLGISSTSRRNCSTG